MSPNVQVSEPEISDRLSDSPILDSNLAKNYFTSFFKNIRLEPVYFFFAISDSIVLMIVQTYFIDKICRLNEGYSEEKVCGNLTSYPDYEKTVEKEASRFFMYQTLIESGFPILLALFLGPLTDKYGYKPLLVYSLSGYVLRSLIYILCFYFPLLPPKYLLFASIPVGLSGGYVTLVISVSGMCADVDVSTRSFRLAILQATWEIGIVIGYICGYLIFKQGSFLPTFFYMFTFYALSLIYTLTVVYEEKHEEEESLLSSGELSFGVKDIVNCSPVREMLHACFKQRAGYGRMVIMIVVAGSSLQYLAHASRGNEYLFTRNMFGWKTQQYSEFSALRTLINGFGSTFISLVLLKILNFRDANVLLINSISNMGGYFIYAFAQKDKEWLMLLGACVIMFGSTTTGILKSVLTKSVNKDECGKLLSLVICVEFSMPFISGPLYTYLYIQMVTTFPGVIFLFAALTTLLVLVLMGILHFITKGREEYSLVIGDS